MNPLRQLSVTSVPGPQIPPAEIRLPSGPDDHPGLAVSPNPLFLAALSGNPGAHREVGFPDGGP